MGNALGLEASNTSSLGLSRDSASDLESSHEFLAACAAGDETRVREMLAVSPDLAQSALDENGYGCVHVAAAAGAANMVRWLLDHCPGCPARLLQWPLDSRHPLSLARVMQHGSVLTILAHSLSHEALGPMLSSSDDAVLLVDSNGTLIGYNRAAKRLLGYRRRELVGVTNSLGRVLLEPPTTPRADTRAVCADGSTLDVEVTRTNLSNGRALLTLKACESNVEQDESLDESKCLFLLDCTTTRVLDSTAHARALLRVSSLSLHGKAVSAIFSDATDLLARIASLKSSSDTPLASRGGIFLSVLHDATIRLEASLPFQPSRIGRTVVSLGIPIETFRLHLSLRVSDKDPAGIRALLASFPNPCPGIDERDYEGRTALHRAASSGDLMVVQALLDGGARIDILDNDGHTPRDLARMVNSEVATLLETARIEQHKRSSGSKLVDLDESTSGVEKRRSSSTDIEKRRSSSTDMARMEVPQNELEYEAELGRGSFGVVYRGRWRHVQVAIKHVRVTRPEDEQALLEEAALMLALRPHPHVVSLLGVCSTPGQAALITEFCARGALDILLSSLDGWRLLPTPRSLCRVLRDVALGVAHLHRERVLHRDIAARNVLLSHDLTAKIADFGLAQLPIEIASNSPRSSSGDADAKSALAPPVSGAARVGAVRWLAPESLRSQIFSEASDAWSFGVLIFECCSRVEPFKNSPLGQVMADIIQNGRHEILPKPPHTPPQLEAIAMACWRMDANLRPQFEDLIIQLNTALNTVEGDPYMDVTLIPFDSSEESSVSEAAGSSTS